MEFDVCVDGNIYIYIYIMRLFFFFFFLIFFLLVGMCVAFSGREGGTRDDEIYRMASTQAT